MYKKGSILKETRKKKVFKDRFMINRNTLIFYYV